MCSDKSGPFLENFTTDEWLDISDELWREYVFSDMTVRIELPARVMVKRKPDGDSHRIVDNKGVAHYIPVGWRHLSWATLSEPKIKF